MGIDETRHHDHARSIDDLGVWRADVCAYRGDLAALDQNVGLFQIADIAVERQHATTLDQDWTSGRVRAAQLLRARRVADRRGYPRGCNGACRAGLEKLAT